MEPINHLRSHVWLMNQYYEWPRTRSEYNIFFKEVVKMEGFTRELIKKCTFGLLQAGGDAGVKMASWQYVFGGTYSPQDFADYNSYKHLICGLVAFTPFCWTGVPFEMARRAYYADKSWPLEL